MKLLKELYMIYSPSRKEHNMSRFISRWLDKNNVEYKKDRLFIYNIKPDTPLLCAHMDHVTHKPINKVVEYKGLLIGDGNLGADDKNGIWIILNLLKEYKDLSFIFTTEEEILGDKLSNFLKKHNIEDCNFGLVFDRRNGKDIIGSLNYYCNEDLEKDIERLSFGYRLAQGSFSDCDALSLYIPCVNLSCGYYQPHSECEYTNKKDLYNALRLGRAIVENYGNKKYSFVEFNNKDYHDVCDYCLDYNCYNCECFYCNKKDCENCEIFEDKLFNNYIDEDEDINEYFFLDKQKR